MKIKHLATILLLVCLMPLASCLKQIGENDVASTIVIGHEEIPNIRAFMPKELLEAFENDINYGHIPSWLQGTFAISTTFQDSILWISDQRISSAKLRFDYNSNLSDSDSTLKHFKADTNNIVKLIQKSAGTPYFEGKYAKNIDPEILSRIYIIGDTIHIDTLIERHFTAYYYEVQEHEGADYQTVNAVMLSGIGPDSLGFVPHVNYIYDTIPCNTLHIPVDSIPIIPPGCIFDTIVQNDSVYYYFYPVIDTTTTYSTSPYPMQIRITKWGYQTLYHIGNNSEPTGLNIIGIDKLFRVPEKNKTTRH